MATPNWDAKKGWKFKGETEDLEVCPWRILSFLFLSLLYLDFEGIPNFERCQVSASAGEGIKKASREGRQRNYYSRLLSISAMAETLSAFTISFAFKVVVYLPPQSRVISVLPSTASL